MNLLFPRRCPVCGGIVVPGQALICPGCLGKLSPIRNPVCKKCGKELFNDQAEYCADCIRHPKTFESGRALLCYDQTAQASVTAIKYKNKREYLDFYAAAMAWRFQSQIRLWKPNALVPVPIHPSRRRRRGFNQAEELAVRLGWAWQVPVYTGLLVRSKKTSPQYGLSASERLRNLQHAFEVSHVPDQPEMVLRSVVLIDDIYTTGSTIEACTRVLKAAGIDKVYFLTICIGNG